MSKSKTSLIDALRNITGKPVKTEYVVGDGRVEFFVKPPAAMLDPEAVFTASKAKSEKMVAEGLNEQTAAFAIILADAYESIMTRAVDETGAPIFASIDDIKAACSNDMEHIFGLARVINNPHVTALDETDIKK